MNRMPGAHPAACLIAGVLSMVACAGGDRGPGPPDLVIEGGWARAMPGGEGAGADVSSAAYFVVRNRGGTPDRLVGGTTAAARGLEIHESREESGVMRMRRVEAIEVPGGGVVELRPGGLHVMLVGLNRSLVEGDTLEVVLRFQRSGDLPVRLPVFLTGPH